MNLYDQAVAESKLVGKGDVVERVSAGEVFTEVVVKTGLLDSLLWFVAGIAVAKFFL